MVENKCCIVNVDKVLDLCSCYTIYTLSMLLKEKTEPIRFEKTLLVFVCVGIANKIKLLDELVIQYLNSEG